MEQQWKPILNLFLQGKSPEIEKKKQENSDGTFRWLKWEIKHWLAVDGSIGGLMMSCIDITKEKNIILNEKLFQSFMAYLRGLCWITDSNNHLKYANSQFIEKFNLTPGVIGKKHEEIFGLDLARVSHQCNMNVLNTKKIRNIIRL